MNHPTSIEISIARQRLWLKRDQEIVLEFPVSTSKNGPGERRGSECTPRGIHVVCEKIGGEQPLNTVFVGRKPTGEVCTADFRACFPARDLILTRILWLAGLEPGVNLGGEVDSRERYIYIHGTPDDQPMGIALSHGCVRMRNQDIVQLYELVTVGTLVKISAD